MECGYDDVQRREGEGEGEKGKGGAEGENGRGGGERRKCNVQNELNQINRLFDKRTSM